MKPNKLERILTLTKILMETPRHLSAADIRRRVPGYPEDHESFRRAFERDKAELREMGIPVVLGEVEGEQVPLAGYRIRPADCVLRDPGLLPDELDALRLAIAVVGSADGAGQRGLHKLGGGAASSPRTVLPADPILESVFLGVAERRRLRFTYGDLDRRVEGYRLQFTRDRWYLLGNDLVRGDLRWYRLDRIRGHVEIEDERASFDRPEGPTPGLELAPWRLGADGSNVVTATVRFDAEIAPFVRAQLGGATVLSDDETGIVAEVVVTNRDGFRSWVLSYLDRAEVLGPSELRAEVVDWLEAVAR